MLTARPFSLASLGTIVEILYIFTLLLASMPLPTDKVSPRSIPSADTLDSRPAPSSMTEAAGQPGRQTAAARPRSARSPSYGRGNYASEPASSEKARRALREVPQRRTTARPWAMLELICRIALVCALSFARHHLQSRKWSCHREQMDHCFSIGETHVGLS
jgi:hypothetical protein